MDTIAFDERALSDLPDAGPFVDGLRRKAYEEFLALPVPSQDTEEWRYTDLSSFRLDLSPDGAAATTRSELDPSLVSKGVILEDLDRAALDHPPAVERHLHRLVPTERTKFTALHGAFRRGGTYLHVPPDVSVEVPIQAVTSLDEDSTAVFPHSLIVVERGAEVTFIERFTSPDLERAFSDAVTEI